MLSTIAVKTLIASTAINDPQRAGEFASGVGSFGNRGRYRLYAVHTRFDAVVWMVDDNTRFDDVVDGMPLVIRQEETPEAALAGF